MSLVPGSSIGPYQVLEKLGEGGMGEVYRARDTRLERTVAIKILSPAVATPDRIERFAQEARAASTLNHPNILTIYDVGQERDTAYFAMEWVDGKTVRELLRQGPVPLRRSVQLVHQIAEGLAKAHDAGIVHRDLKPENVMLSADGVAKIVDFGLVKLNAGPQAVAAAGDLPTVTRAAGTQPGLVMGTVGYMSPEQASGLAVDYRSDQFALGLLIYELLTRARPFDRQTTAQTLAATIDVEPTPVDTLNPEVPPHLAAVVTRCLAKDPAERYESTRDLARDLKAILEASSRVTTAVPVRRQSVSTRALIAVVTLVLVAASASVAWYWKSRPVATDRQERPLIAVRPFRSLSADPQQAFFAAGMTDEIRGQLSQVSALRLLSRNGLDGYKEGEVSRAVRELGVRNFVDGSIRVDGRRVRVSAELVDASNQQTLWSDQYDRDLADVLAVQGDIAQQIARALHTSLSPHESQRLALRPTESVEAYALYVQSNQLPPTDRERNLEAIELLRKALVLDPRFAAAQARIGYRLIFMSYYDDAAYLEQGVAEVEAALRIDPSLPYAYFALGTAHGIRGREAQSRQAFLRALELDPNNTSAMNNFSVEELQFGRLDDAAYWARRSFALSGKRGNDYYHLILPLETLRADAASRTLLEEAERRFPTFARVQILLAQLEVFEGHVERAVSRLDALLARYPQDEEVRFYRADVAFMLDAPHLEAALDPLMLRSASNFFQVAETVRLKYAYALARRGEAGKAAAHVAEAERIARERVDRGDRSPALRIELAAAAALHKDANAALDWLERALELGYRDYGLLERDPILAPLRTDPRYRDVLDRMRKDVDAQRARAGERGLLDVAGLF